MIVVVIARATNGKLIAHVATSLWRAGNPYPLEFRLAWSKLGPV